MEPECTLTPGRYEIGGGGGVVVRSGLMQGGDIMDRIEKSSQVDIRYKWCSILETPAAKKDY